MNIDLLFGGLIVLGTAVIVIRFVILYERRLRREKDRERRFQAHPMDES